jgi:hypothetical protein
MGKTSLPDPDFAVSKERNCAIKEALHSTSLFCEDLLREKFR